MTEIEYFPMFSFWVIRRGKDNQFKCTRLPPVENPRPCSEFAFMESFQAKHKLKKGDKRVVCTCTSKTYPDTVGIAIWHPKDARNYDFDPYKAQRIALGRMLKKLRQEGKIA